MTLLLWSPRGEEGGEKLGGTGGEKARDSSQVTSPGRTAWCRDRGEGADAGSSRPHRPPPEEVRARTVRGEARPPRAASRDRRRWLGGRVHVTALTSSIEKYGPATPVRPLQLSATRVQSGALERGGQFHIPGCRQELGKLREVQGRQCKSAALALGWE